MSDKNRVKKWAPKTFNGCQTCKCVRSKLQCEGYAPPTVRVFEPSKPSEISESALDGKAHSYNDEEATQSDADEKNVHSEQAVATSSNDFVVQPSIPWSNCPAQLESLKYFLEKTSHEISVYQQQQHFWTVIVPQATWHTPAIRHSVIALSILHEILTSTNAVSAESQAQLIHHYNLAIREIVQGTPSIDIILMTCMLFWVIETFNGTGEEPTVDHMTAATRILDEWKSTATKTGCSRWELITKYIEPAIRDNHNHEKNRRAINVQEEPVGPAIGRQDESFSSLRAAAEDLLSGFECCFILDLIFSEPDRTGWPIEKLSNIVAAIGRHFQNWLNRFQSLNDIAPRYIRRFLLLHHVLAMLMFDVMQMCLEMIDGSRTVQARRFAYMMEELEDLLCNQPIENAAAFDEVINSLGFIPLLFTVAIQSLDPDIQQRAISLLLGLKRNEGCWNAVLAAKIAGMIISIHVHKIESQKQILNAINVKFEHNTPSLKLTYSTQEGLKERSIRLTSEENANIDAEKLTSLVHHYGYIFDA